MAISGLSLVVDRKTTLMGFKGEGTRSRTFWFLKGRGFEVRDGSEKTANVVGATTAVSK